jgi:tRNA-(ms[2]io[6]A)-hydroxylase
MISEANHYTLFLKLARKYGPSKETVDQKWQSLLDYEATVIRKLGDKESIHG